MGRKTFESIGRPLPLRTNIVVSKEMSQIEGITIAKSLEQAIELAKAEESKQPKPEIFFIGGSQIYTQSLPLVDKLYLTIVNGEKTADTFFPDYTDFKRKVSEQFHLEHNPPYSFIELEK